MGGGGYFAYIGDGVTFGAATPTTISGGGSLYFNGTTNPTFNTELIFGDTNSNSLVSSTSVLTLGSSAFVHGASGYIGYSPLTGVQTASLINNGIIDADTSGGGIYISPASFTNNGTLKAENGGSLNVSVPFTSTGVVQVNAGSSVSVKGWLSCCRFDL